MATRKTFPTAPAYVRVSLNDSTIQLDALLPFVSGGQLPPPVSINRAGPSAEPATGSSASPSFTEQHAVVAILGAARLLDGLYLVTVLAADKIADFLGAPVFRIRQAALLRLSPKSKLSADRQHDEAAFTKMLLHSLEDNAVFFSPGVDLSVSRQHAAEGKRPADDGFTFNHAMRHNLFSVSAGVFEAWTVRAICGFFETTQQSINGQVFSYYLIARRSRFRAGARLLVRGIDRDGHVANFVETEQIVVTKTHVMSFLQLRGSIPVFWSQLPDIKYKPKIKLETKLDPAAAFQRHVDRLTADYHKQVFINLVDQKGSELLVSNAFEAQVKALGSSSIKYNMFDFHKECSNMRYDRLSKLLSQVTEDISAFGYFSAALDQPTSAAEKRQLGTFRTNCIDCLDRTNVVQSLIARRVLATQLQDAGVFTPTDKVESHRALESFFKNVWADHADAISTQYSGTGALKTDFTRTGKRTIKGALNDGVNSAIRYVKNNFLDGYRQDAFDLALGNHTVSASSPSRARDSPLRLPALVLVVYLWIVSILLFFPSDLKSLIIFLFVQALFLFGTFKALTKMRHFFVDKPKLVPIESS